MIALSLVAMLAGATLPAYTLPPARRARPVKCSDACANRYRLPIADNGTPTIKSRALAEDGSKCNVVGAKRCTSKGRTVWRSEY